MKVPTVSVVIPTYNYGHFISGAIDSILGQSFLPEEIIVIDDGSTDNTAEIISQYLSKENSVNIVYFKKQNSGPASARNEGIARVQAEFTLLLDADDKLLPKAFENLIQPILHNQAIDLVVGAYVLIDSRGNEHYRSAPLLRRTTRENFKAYLRKKISIVHGGFLTRSTVLRRIRYPEYLRCSEDQSVFAQLLATANSMSISEPVVQILHHNDSLRHNASLSIDSGLKVVDAIFDSEILSLDLFKYKNECYARRCLSVFRTLYKANRDNEAVYYYWLAVTVRPYSLLKLSYLTKYFRLKVRKYYQKFRKY